MKPHRTMLMIAAGLLVLGIASFALQPLLDPRPETRCAKEGAPTSGYTDDEKQDCNVTIDSLNEISDWESKPKPFRIVGLLLVVGAVVVGTIAFVRGRRGPDPPGA